MGDRQTSSCPLTRLTVMGGGQSSCVSITARMEFLNSSNSMWYKWDGTYTIGIGPCDGILSRSGRQRCTLRSVMPVYDEHPLLNHLCYKSNVSLLPYTGHNPDSVLLLRNFRKIEMSTWVSNPRPLARHLRSLGQRGSFVLYHAFILHPEQALPNTLTHCLLQILTKQTKKIPTETKNLTSILQQLNLAFSYASRTTAATSQAGSMDPIWRPPLPIPVTDACLGPICSPNSNAGREKSNQNESLFGALIGRLK
ncbi:hypothetical protein SFRURICE_020937 [Spodoptera frugiperda]|nr:hypothetical protein SFRURICE_020937 [Spodoptera frugiperda]